MEEAGGRQDCVQECVRFSAVRGHGDVREDRRYGDHEWAARRPGEDSGGVGKSH